MLFGRDLHSWEQWMLGSLGLAAFAAVAVVVTTASVVILTRSAAENSKNELEAYKLTVDGKVADARTEGINAGKAASDARLKAAELEKKSQELKAANLALEAQIAPRRLTSEQQKALASALSPFAGQSVILRSYSLDAESALLGKQIAIALEAAKLILEDRLMSESAMGAMALGVHVVGTNPQLVGTLLGSLSKIGRLLVSPDPPPAPVMHFGGGGVYGPATIFVGPKPISQ